MTKGPSQQTRMATAELLQGVRDDLARRLTQEYFADILESDGWNARFLGANVPNASIVQAVGEHEADVLGVSMTMLYHVTTTERLIRDVRARFGDELRIVVGGAAFRHDPNLASAIGTDGFAADLGTAVETFRDVAQPA